MAWSGYRKYAFLIFIPIVIFIIVAVSNGANLTDGIDGLAAGTSAIIGTTLGILLMFQVILFLPIILISCIYQILASLLFMSVPLSEPVLDFSGIIHYPHKYLWVIREVLPWRNHCSVCNYYSERTFNSTTVRNISYSKYFSNYAGVVFQIY